jgi:AcrR family transcriptional regulator
MDNHMTHHQQRSEAKLLRYHHGDLRRTLLRVARDEIAQHGAKAVSLSSLARCAGVSQPAPYRHFADREALLEGVAAEGFEEFTAGLAKAMADLSTHDALKAIALAYLAFGEDNIEIYRLMFASRLTTQAKSEGALGKASEKAFELLLKAVSAMPFTGSAEENAYLFWARLHGLVMLKADGFITRPLSRFVNLSS